MAALPARRAPPSEPHAGHRGGSGAGAKGQEFIVKKKEAGVKSRRAVPEGRLIQQEMGVQAEVRTGGSRFNVRDMTRTE